MSIKKKYDHVRISNGVNEALDGFLKTDTARRIGLVSKVDVVNLALRDLFEKYDFSIEKPRLKHYNYYEDRVTVFDEFEKKLIDIHNKDGVFRCSFCESNNCIHGDFAYSLPEVQRAVREGKIKKKYT